MVLTTQKKMEDEVEINTVGVPTSSKLWGFSCLSHVDIELGPVTQRGN